MQKPSGIIAFLTDVGSLDPYSATMDGVALGICPSAKLVLKMLYLKKRTF